MIHPCDPRMRVLPVMVNLSPSGGGWGQAIGDASVRSILEKWVADFYSPHLDKWVIDHPEEMQAANPAARKVGGHSFRATGAMMAMRVLGPDKVRRMARWKGENLFDKYVQDEGVATVSALATAAGDGLLDVGRDREVDQALDMPGAMLV